MTGSAAEEALQRAKAIAARLQQESLAGGRAGATTASSATNTTATASAVSPTSTTTTPGEATTTTTTGSSSSKRRRWGLAPDGVVEGVTGTSTTVLGDLDATKRFKVATAENNSSSSNNNNSSSTPKSVAEKVSKRMWISTSAQRPAIHFVNFMKDDLELVPSKLTVQDKDSVTVSLEGRGSGGKQPLAGVPLEPLHVLIEAPSQDILSQAELIVDELLQRAEEEPVHPDIIAAAIADGSESAGAETKKNVSSTSMALATIQDPSMTRSSSTAYRPASVAQLIGQVNHGGGTGGGSDWVDEVIPVPVGVVGFIIGKGGENIAMLQSRTGARVQVQRETDSAAAASATHRNIQVSAPNHQALEQCRQLIHSTVQEKSKMLTGSSGGGNMNRKDAMRLEEALAQGHVHLKLPIPDDDVGLVIGKGGATIRSLQDRTGASIQVPSAQESIDGKRTVHITHPTQQGAEHAQRLIKELLQSNNNSQATSGANPNNNNSSNNANSNNANNGVPNPSEPQVTASMMIPDADVGLIIGRQGTVIRYLQDSTRTRIQIPPHCLPGQDHRLATITGPTQGCAQVQAMMGQIIADQSSAGVMAQAPPTAGGGEGAGNYGNAYNNNAQLKKLDNNSSSNNQQEYSADWAAYHAAQAAAAAHPVAPYHAHPAYATPYPYHQQQQQQQHHWGGTPAVSAAPAHVPQVVAPPAHEAYYEQFFRYAYYYGEPAARQYYGAWAPPVGTANPYGVNPNGVQPVPAGGGAPMAASPSPAPAPAQAQQQPAHTMGTTTTDGRETSVRKVSNLPAWMNKS